MVEAEESDVQGLPQFYTKFEAGWSDILETPSQKQNNKSKLKKVTHFKISTHPSYTLVSQAEAKCWALRKFGAQNLFPTWCSA